MAKNITVALLLKKDQFVNGMKDAVSSTTKLKTAVLAAGVAGAAALGGLTAIALKQMDSIDGIAKSARRLGTSFTGLQSLQRSAELAGVSADTLTVSLNKLQITLGRAATDAADKANKTFKQLGLSSKELAEMSTDQAFAAITAELNKIENPAERAARSMELLGKQGPLLLAAAGDAERLNEAMEKLGLTLSKEDTDAVEAANDAIAEFKFIVESAAQVLAAEMAPVIRDVVNSIKNYIVENGGAAAIIREQLIPAIKIAAGVLAAFGGALVAVKIAGFVTGIIAATRATYAFTVSLMRNPLGLVAVAVATLIAGFVALVQQTGSVKNAFATMGNSVINIANRIIQAYNAAGVFVIGMMRSVGKAIMAGLNPFGEAGFADTLSAELKKTFANAQRTLTAAGPITAQFALDPVPQRRRGTVDIPQISAVSDTPAADDAAAKAAKKAADAAAKSLEQRNELALRNLQTVREGIAALGVETQVLGKRLDLDIQLVGAAEDYAEQQNKLLDIELQRNKTIADIQAKELSTDPIENARLLAAAIADVNREYDAQTSQLDKLIERRRLDIQLQTSRASARAVADQAGEVMMAQARIANLTEAFEFEKQYNLDVVRARAEANSKLAALQNEELGMNEEVRRAREEQIRSELRDKIQSAAVIRSANQQVFDAEMSFATGIAQAQNEAMMRLMDNAQFARNMFNITMQGFTDSVLKFVETGKLSFKDLFRSLMTEIIKMQANKLFLSFFGKGGVLGNLLGLPTPGARAVGGPVRAGMPYVVGERGPELFVPSGPGTVIANDRMGGGGVTQVTYNINAVDAASFKQLVAADPEFIYSVSQAGARRLPR